MSYRYIGNKTRLLPQILDTIGALARPGAKVVDLMCGTAAVAAGLRANGYRVVASDIMTYAVHHARVRLLLKRAPSFAKLDLEGYRGVLANLNALKPVRGTFHREYSPAGKPRAKVAPRMYFTPANAGRIDAISRAIRLWREDEKIGELEHALLRHDLILAANRVANIAGTYGHFRSSWSNGSSGALELLPTIFAREGSIHHEVLQGRAEDIARHISADICYIDPPYMKRQYAANYHIIETLARGDDPDAIGSSGLRPWRDQYSNFCTKTKIFESFHDVIGQMDCPKFILSYSEDGLLSRGKIVDLLSEHGDVSVSEIEFARFRSNQSPLSRTLKEYVFVLSKRVRRPSRRPILSRRADRSR